MPIVSGGGGAAFNGGTITRPLVIATTNPNVIPLQVRVGLAAQNVDVVSVKNTDDSSDIAVVTDSGIFTVGHGTSLASLFGGSVTVTNAGPTAFAAGPNLYVTRQIAAGALPTVQLVSGTGAQPDTNSDRYTVTRVTFNPGAATTATCLVQVSVDDVTYSTLWTETVPVGVALDGTIHDVSVYVPESWFLKLTVTNAVLGLTTYY